MRSTAKALSGLLLLAQKGSVTVSGRGINDKGECLYEVKTFDGALVCHVATEDEVIAVLSSGIAAAEIHLAGVPAEKQEATQ